MQETKNNCFSGTLFSSRYFLKLLFVATALAAFVNLKAQDTLKPGEVVYYPVKANAADIKKRDTIWKAKNSIFIEYGGTVSFFDPFTLNYDRLLFTSKWIKLSARIGSNWPRIGNRYDLHSGSHDIPIFFNVLFGKQLSIELGVGTALIYDYGYNFEHKIAFYGAAASLGVRYNNKKQGIMFRAGLTPGLAFPAQSIYTFTLLGLTGISLGYSF